MKLFLRCQTPENARVIRDVLAEFPTGGHVYLECDSGVYFLECAKSSPGIAVQQMFVPIPLNWVEDPLMKVKLEATTRNFASYVQEWIS